MHLRRNGIRLVTHNDVSAGDCKLAIMAIRSLLESGRALKSNGTGSSLANGAAINEAPASKAYK